MVPWFIPDFYYEMDFVYDLASITSGLTSLRFKSYSLFQSSKHAITNLAYLPTVLFCYTLTYHHIHIY